MEYKEAIEILKALLEKRALDDKAVMTAMGVLSWVSLSKSRVKAIKAKRDRAGEW